MVTKLLLLQCTSLQLSTGPQTTNVSENVNSGSNHLVQNAGSSTGDVSQPLHNPTPAAATAV